MVHVMAVGERPIDMGRNARGAPIGNAATSAICYPARKKRPYRRTRAGSSHVIITSPEQCDQSVICGCSLKQIGNE